MGIASTIVKNLAAESAPTFGKFVEEQPGLFSKLADVVRGTNFGKMDSRQLNKTLLNKGVTVDEIADTLSGLYGSVSKQQVVDRIGERGIKTEDVMLGGQGKYTVEENNGPKGTYYSVVGNDGTWYNNHNSIRSALNEIKEYNALDKVPETQYSTWALLGAKEGSYREMFVTVPNGYSFEKHNKIAETLNRVESKFMEDNPDLRGTEYPAAWAPVRDQILGDSGFTFAEWKAFKKSGWKDGHPPYDNIQSPIVRIRFNDREVGPEGKKILFVEEIQGPQGDQKYQILQKTPASTGRSEAVQKMFTDVGLSNDTVTRKHIFDTKEEALLFTKKNGIDSSLVSKVVEGEQGKMPPALQERIYDIGVKRILAYAKENGYDGVAWTPGKMQADRYSLAKQVKQIEVTSSKAGRDGYTVDAMDHNGNIVIRNQKVANAEELANTIGKDLASKAVRQIDDKNYNAIFQGLDLEIGGEGLKSLYDVRIPSLFKKYGKAEVGTIRIPTKSNPLDSSIQYGEDVPFIPITKQTPSRYPIYGLAPLTALGIGTNQFGPQYFKDNQTAQPRGF
jgi:hypothetical protein